MPHANVGVVWWDVLSLQRQLKKMLRSPHAYEITCTLPLEAEGWFLAGPLDSQVTCPVYSMYILSAAKLSRTTRAAPLYIYGRRPI